MDPSKLKPDLRPVLDALHIPVESKIAVFSKTGPNNPRTIFFNDSVTVGWMKGGFITWAMRLWESPGWWSGAPTRPADGSPMLIYGGSVVDHRTPIEDRWGGWFVTGAPAGLRHLGNAVIGPQGDPKTLESLQGNIDAKDAIYKWMLRVLSGSEKSKKYARLSAADRRAVLEILRETKKDFPGVVN